METNNFEVLALTDVSASALQENLSARGLAWKNLRHVSATHSLASAFRDSGTLSHPIGLLFDMFVATDVRSNSYLGLDMFPDSALFHESKETRESYLPGVKSWTQALSHKRLHQASSWSQALRDSLTELDLETDLKHLIRRNSSDLLTAFIKLSNDGIYPSDFPNTSTTIGYSKLQSAAIQIWSQLEIDFPDFSVGREGLWIDLEEYRAGDSALAKDVSKRLRDAFTKSYGFNSEPVTLVHHGFYFYTPLQWAFFKLIQETPGFNQIFIIHDDGKNPALRIWREFFSERLSMPSYRLAEQKSAPKTKRAKFFLDLISGESRTINMEHLNLSIAEHQNTSEFARELRGYKESIGDSSPQIYAPAVKDVKRFVDRVLNPSTQNPTNLIELPSGIFLQSVHDCIKVAADGSHSLVPTKEEVQRILGSGFLRFGPSDGNREGLLAIRALRFFQDCSTTIEWKTRADKLARLIVDEVHNLDPAGIERQTKLGQVKASSLNPLRVLPWLDFSVSEALSIKNVIHKIMNLLEQVHTTERITLGEHADSIASAIKEWMSNASIEEQSRVSKALEILRVADDGEVDAIGLADVVSRILNGVEDDNDSQTSTIDDFDPQSLMRMGDLDRLGFRQTAIDTHICNLAEGSFPSQQNSAPWPFTMESFDVSLAAKYRKISVEIYRLRNITSTLEDLYLFWLALEGVSDEAKLQLSWITRVGSEDKLPSNFIRICSRISKVSTATSDYLGGLKIANSTAEAANFNKFRSRVSLEENFQPEFFVQGVSRFGIVAASSNIMCSRRFAVQWALSESASFEPDHTQEILYGNLLTPIYYDLGGKNNPYAFEHAGRLQRDIGASLPEAVRASSDEKRVVKTGGASPVWIHSLGGSKNGQDRTSLAYQAVLGGKINFVDAAHHGSRSALPVVEPTKEQQSVCSICPISKTCISAVSQLAVEANS